MVAAVLSAASPSSDLSDNYRTTSVGDQIAGAITVKTLTDIADAV